MKNWNGHFSGAVGKRERFSLCEYLGCIVQWQCVKKLRQLLFRDGVWNSGTVIICINSWHIFSGCMRKKWGRYCSGIVWDSGIVVNSMKIGAYCSVGVSVCNLVFYASQPVQLYQANFPWKPYENLFLFHTQPCFCSLHCHLHCSHSFSGDQNV